MSSFNFDATQVNKKSDTPNSFPGSVPELLPKGAYAVTVAKAEEKVSAAGSEYLSLGFKVVEGEHQGAWIWDIFCTNHEREDVRGWAQESLASLCHALGKPQITHTNDFFDVVVVSEIYTKKGQGDWPAKNAVRGYLPYTGTVTPPPSVKPLDVLNDDIPF